MSVPLADGDLRGALTLYRAHDPLFTTEDGRVMATIAPKLAGAVANGLRFRRAADEAVTDAMTGLPNVAAPAGRRIVGNSRKITGISFPDIGSADILRITLGDVCVTTKLPCC